MKLREVIPNYQELQAQGWSNEDLKSEYTKRVSTLRPKAPVRQVAEQPPMATHALEPLSEEVRDAQKLDGAFARYGAGFGEGAIEGLRGRVGKPLNYIFKSEETPYAKALRENNVPLDTTATLPDNFVNPTIGWDEQTQSPTIDATPALGTFGQTAFDANLEKRLQDVRRMQDNWQAMNPDKINIAGGFGQMTGGMSTSPEQWVALPVASAAVRIPAMFAAGATDGALSAWGGDRDVKTGALVGGAGAVVFGEVIWGLSKIGQKIAGKFKNNLDKPEVLETPEAKVFDAEARANDEDKTIKHVSDELQGASPEEVRAAVNAKRQVLPEDKELSLHLNEGQPVADEMSGMRLLTRLRNTIDAGMMSEEELGAKLSGYGIKGEYKQKTLEAYRKKDPNILAEWIYMREQEAADALGVPKLDDVLQKMDEGIQELKTKAPALESIEAYPMYDELLQMREGVKASDMRYSNTQTAKGALNSDGEYVGGTLYEPNYNADFELTGRDVEALRTGRATPEQIEKAKRDLGVLENDPKWTSQVDDSKMPIQESQAVVQTLDGFEPIEAGGSYGKWKFNEPVRAKTENDGTVLVQYSSGDRMAAFPDGKLIVLHADGSYTADVDMGGTPLRGKNGEILTNEGAMVTEVARRFKSANEPKMPPIAKEEVGPDGEIIYKNAEGESVDEKGQLLFANGGETMGGGLLGGADSLINERDYDNDGEYTYKDLLYGVATGAISANALRRLAPKLFETPRGGQKAGSIHPTTKNVDIDVLNSFAEPLAKNDSVLKFVADFKEPIETPIGPLKVNHDYMLNKATERDGGKRLEAIGYIKPTLERPAYIIENDGKIHFIKPFIDEQEKVRKFLSVVSDREGNINFVTSTIQRDKDIKRLAKNGKVIEDFTKRVEDGTHTSSGMSVKEPSLGLDTPEGQILPQNALHVKEPLPKGAVRVDGDAVEARLLESPTLAQKEAAFKEAQNAKMEEIVNETPINSIKEATELLDKSVTIHGGIAEPIWRAAIAPLKKIQEGAIKRFDALGKIKGRVEQARVEKVSQATFKRLTQIDPKGIKESGFYDGATIQPKTTVDSPSMSAQTTLQAPTERFEVVVNEDGSKEIYRLGSREVFDESITNAVKKEFFDNYDPEFIKMIHMRSAGEMNSLKRTNEIFKTLQQRLKEGDSKSLVQALDGDLDPKELSPEVANLYATTRKLIDERAKILVDLGMLKPEDVKGDYVRRFYAEHVERKGLLDGLKEGMWNREKKSGGGDGQHKRKDMTQEEREGLGQVFHAPYVIAETMALQERQILKGIFYDDVAKRFGATDQLKGYAQVPDEKRFGKLAGKYVPSHVKYAIVDAPEYMSAGTRLYREMFSHWKVNKTVKNPFTHAYNIGSNVELMVMSHTDPVHLVRQIRSGKWKEAVAIAERYGMIDDARLMYDLYEGVKLDKLDPNAKGNQAYDVLKTLFKNAYMTEDSAVGKGMRWAYNWEDKIFKIMRMQHNLFNAKKAIYEAKHGEVALGDEWLGGVRKEIDAMTLSKEAEYEAFREANALFVDYQKPLPPAWERLNRYAIPFLQFSVKSTPIKIRLMMQNPATAMSINFLGGGWVGRAAAAGAAYTGYQETADFISKYFDADIDRQAHHEWMRPNEVAGVEFDNVMGIVPWRPLPMYETDENAVYFNQGRLVQGMRGDMIEAMAGAGFPGMLYSYASGMDVQRGRAYRDKDDTTYEKVEKTARKMAQDLLPPLWGTYASKYAEAFMYGENLYGEMMEPADVTLQTLGVRRVNKAQAEKRAQDEIQAKIRKVTNVDKRVAAVKAQRTKHERTGGATGYSERRANEQLEKIADEATRAQKQLVNLQEDAKRVQGWSGYDSLNPPNASRRGSGIDIGMPKKMIDLGF